MRSWSGRAAPVAAFTLIEMMVCFTIISVLMAVLMPSLSAAKEKANRAKCTSNLRQIGIADYNYAADHDGWFFTGVPYNGWSSTWNATAYSEDLEQLQPYIVKTDLLYCPSVLRKNIHAYSTDPFYGVGDQPSNIIKPWGQLGQSYVSYCYVAGGVPTSVRPDQVLFYERPRFHGLGGWSIDQNTWAGVDYVNVQLGTAAIIMPNGSNVGDLAGHSYCVSDTAHGNEGSNILYADGHVSWKKGQMVGPLYMYIGPWDTSMTLWNAAVKPGQVFRH
ncbi:MAG: DUF1559 domain-containing protein [Verrucomicrobiae bacterium]|nr:DUF1559 domain-containing protein [Verrucomicrobiae bacterium]